MNRSILEQPFEGKLIKTRRGAFGKMLSYVEGTEYIRRLNDAFDGQWSFEITGYQVYTNEVMVLGKLTAGDISKTAFGGSSITNSSQSGDPISIADDLKAAATDALKKASTLLGLGLDLYSDSGNQTRNNIVPIDRIDPAGGRSNGNGKHNDHQHGDDGDAGADRVHRNDRLTQKQLAAIWSIGRALGVNAQEIRRRSVELHGVVPEQLSKSEASSLLSRMQEALPSSSAVRQ